MSVYRITYDDQARIVEAADFGDAVKKWLEGMKEPWGDDWIGTEQPESVLLISEEPVIR